MGKRTYMRMMRVQASADFAAFSLEDVSTAFEGSRWRLLRYFQRMELPGGGYRVLKGLLGRAEVLQDSSEAVWRGSGQRRKGAHYLQRMGGGVGEGVDTADKAGR